MTDEPAIKAVSVFSSNASDTMYREVKTSVISQVQTVRIYPETYEKVRLGHREVPIDLPSMEAAIDSALQYPTHVEESYNNSLVFVDTGSTNAGGDPLRLPVKLIEGTSARLKSVYFASSNSDSNNVIWRRGEDDKS